MFRHLKTRLRPRIYYTQGYIPMAYIIMYQSEHKVLRFVQRVWFICLYCMGKKQAEFKVPSLTIHSFHSCSHWGSCICSAVSKPRCWELSCHGLIPAVFVNGLDLTVDWKKPWFCLGVHSYMDTQARLIKIFDTAEKKSCNLLSKSLFWFDCISAELYIQSLQQRATCMCNIVSFLGMALLRTSLTRLLTYRSMLFGWNWFYSM